MTGRLAAMGRALVCAALLVLPAATARAEVGRTWPPALDALRAQYDAFGSLVVVIGYAPRAAVDYSTPQRARSTSQALIGAVLFAKDAYVFGHIDVAWSCRTGDGQGGGGRVEGATGLTGDVIDYLALAARGLGMLSLFVTTEIGTLRDSAMVEQSIADGPRRSWTAFLVDDAACADMTAFVDRFQATGAYRNFGLTADPMTMEGGICSSFVASVLRVAGLNGAHVDRWRQIVPVPLDVTGLPDGRVPDGYRVFGADTAVIPPRPAPFDFYLDERFRWALPGEPHITFNYIDPTLLVADLAAQRRGDAFGGRVAGAADIAGVQGLVIDIR